MKLFLKRLKGIFIKNKEPIKSEVIQYDIHTFYCHGTKFEYKIKSRDQ